MEPIKNEHTNKVYSAPGCFDLPAYNDGARTIICYDVTPDDLAQMADTGKFYVTLHAGTTVPPIAVGVNPPYYGHKDMKCMIPYESVILKGSADMLLVWNTVDAEAPRLLKTDKGTYRRVPALPAALTHFKEIKRNDYILVSHPEDGRTVLIRVDDPTTGKEAETIFEIPQQ